MAVGGAGTQTAPATAAALALALAAGPSGAGSWVCAVGMPGLGLVAAAEAGIALERFALIPLVFPGGRPNPPSSGAWGPTPTPGRGSGSVQLWADVVASLIDGFDLVLARPPIHLKAGVARRLVARARERQSVLVGVGGWPEGASMRIDARVSEWVGLGSGRDGGSGHLSSVRRDLRATGRIIRRDQPVFDANSPNVRSA